ncbi:MAG: class I SAM-dependent methyltransferase [Acidimicrobiia bacterium]
MTDPSRAAQFPDARVAENRWVDAAHARAYLAARDEIPYRTEGMAALAEFLPAGVERVLDLGTGDGVTLALVRELRPGVEGLATDFNDEMLERARVRFGGDAAVRVVAHDLDEPLPASWGEFDVVVSSFAIHHVADARKRTLFREVFDRLRPGGAFVNLEHVASPTPRLHEEFLATLGIAPVDDDPSNILAPVDLQLAWLREAGFDEVDCHWKWRELALLGGVRP